MTNLQVQYQQLQEQKRANLAQEELKAKDLSLKKEEIGIKDREAGIKQQEALTKQEQIEIYKSKLPYEINKLIADTDLSEQQKDNLTATLGKIEAEIDNLNADTRLTNTQRMTEITKVISNGYNILHRIFGVTGLGDSMDTIKDWIGSFIGGVSKGVKLIA